MKKFYENIADALSMLYGLEKDLNIKHFSPNELKVFYTIITHSMRYGGTTIISDVVSESGMSRSTVYKTLKKLTNKDIVKLDQSEEDKREYLITLNRIS